MAEDMSERGRPTWVLGVAAFIVTAVVACCVWIIYETVTTTKVPKAPATISSSDADSCKTFIEAKLKCRMELVTDEAIPRFTLVSQSHPFDEKVKKDTEVVVKYSKGPAVLKLSELRNETVANAKVLLDKYGITLHEEAIVADSGLQEGRIVSSKPEAGTEVKNGGTVKVTVANGKVTVPDWKGQAKEIVEADAKEKSINVTFAEQENDGPAGIVLSQSATGLTAMNDTVTVTISKARAAKEVVVPKVIGMKTLDAQVALATAGFTHINLVTVEKEGVTEEKVVAVSPGEGATAKSDDIITITVEAPKK